MLALSHAPPVVDGALTLSRASVSPSPSCTIWFERSDKPCAARRERSSVRRALDRRRPEERRNDCVVREHSPFDGYRC